MVAKPLSTVSDNTDMACQWARNVLGIRMYTVPSAICHAGGYPRTSEASWYHIDDPTMQNQAASTRSSSPASTCILDTIYCLM